MNKAFLILLLTTLTDIACKGQNGIVSKEQCGPDKRYKLYLSLKTGNDTLFSRGLYELDGFTTLHDTIKLEIIKELLEFEKDTSRCCLRVSGYVYSGMEGCKGSPHSTYFTIQVDALFMINRLCFSRLTDLYSCHPVLYDTLEQEEINTRPDLIAEVYKKYRKWYQECKAKGYIGKYFPFNDGRYVWYAGSKSKYPKDQAP